MIKAFDGSQKMMADILYIDSKSFKDRFNCSCGRA